MDIWSPSSASEQAPRRRRRLNNSSEPKNVTVSSTLSAEGYTDSPGRVGAPALFALPVRTVTPDTAIEDLLDPLRPQLNAVLDEHDIIGYEMHFVCRVSADDDDEGGEQLDPSIQKETLTVLFYAPEPTDVNKAWLHAVDSMRIILRSNQFAHVQVEMLEWVVEPDWYIGLLPKGHLAYTVWDSSVNDSIVKILENDPLLRDTWCSTSVVTYGWRPTNNEPMVLIRIDDHEFSQNHAASSWNQIRTILDGAGLHDIRPWFERGSVQAESDIQKLEGTPDPMDLIDGPYTTQVNMGASFGTADYFRKDSSGQLLKRPFGTIGGYIRMKPKGANDDCKIFAVTNYHAVRSAIPGFRYGDSSSAEQGSQCVDLIPETGSELHDKDRTGFDKEDATTYILIESPSRRCHNETIADLQDRILQMEDRINARPNVPVFRERRDDLQRELRGKLEFFNDGLQEYGSLALGSGFAQRTKLNGRIDYALIEVKSERQGLNLIPDGCKWPGNVDRVVTNTTLHGIDSLKKERKVALAYMVGARSGARIGVINDIMDNVRMRGHDYVFSDESSRPSREYVFVSASRPTPGIESDFGVPGDSGSFVFDEDGCLVGMGSVVLAMSLMLKNSSSILPRKRTWS